MGDTLNEDGNFFGRSGRIVSRPEKVPNEDHCFLFGTVVSGQCSNTVAVSNMHGETIISTLVEQLEGSVRGFRDSRGTNQT